MIDQPFENEIVSVRQRLGELELRSASLPSRHRAFVTEVLESLSTTMEELQVAGEELRQQNEELLASARELEAARQRYQDLFEFAPDGYLVTDREGVIREANRAAGELLAIASRRLIGLPLVVFIAIKDREEFHRRLTRLHRDRQQQNSEEWEVEVLPHTGRLFPAALTVAPERDDKGGLTGLRWLLRDVSASQRAAEREKLLAQSEQDRRRIAALNAQAQQQAAELEAVFAALVDPMTVYDSTGAILRANPAAVESLGLDPVGFPAAVVGQNVSVRYPDGRSVPADELVAARALRGETVRDEPELIVRARGDERAIVATGAPIATGGQISGAVVAWHDITELKRAEAALRQANERLEFALAASGAGSWDWDIPSGQLEWSPKMFELFGLDMRTTAASFDTWRSVLHPDDGEATERRINLALETHTDLASEYRITQPNGRLRWISALGRGQYDEQGKPSRMSGLCLDITDRKLAEAEVEHLSSFPQLNPNPVLEIDASGRIVFYNAGATQAIERLGLEGGARAFLPDDLAGILQELSQRKESQFQREVQLGAATFAETVQVIPAFNVVRIYAYNITKRKRAEHELLATNQRLAALMDALPVGVSFSEDTTCQRISGNPELLAQFEITPADNISASAPSHAAAGRQVRYFLDGREIIDAELPLQRAVAEKRVIPPMELEIHLPSGKRWFAEASGAPICDSEGNILAGLAVTVDITEHKRTEQALRESEEKLSALFDILPIGLSVLDQERNLRRQNRALSRILGLTEDDLQRRAQEDRLYLRGDGTVMPPEEFPSVRAFHSQREVRDVEIGVVKGDGERIWTSVSAAPLPFSDWRVAVSTVDITKRKRAEEALRSTTAQAENEKRHLEAVLQALPIGVVITDAQGGVLLTNGMDEQIWGLRPATHNVDDYVQYKAWWADSGRPVEPHEWASAQAVEKGASVFGQVLEIQRFDGEHRVVLNSAVPIRDAEGRVIGSAVAIQDITELRRAEQALRESEERFRTVVENSRDGINMLDLETGRYVFMSPAQVKLTGFSAEEMNNLPVEEAHDRVHPDDREKSVSQQQEIVAGREQGSTVEYRWKVKSGEYRWFSDSRAVVRDQQGRAVALVGVSRDITEQKRAEEALRASEEKFANMFRVSPTGLVIARAHDGTVLDVNQAFASALGYERSELMGVRVGDVNLIPSSDARRTLVQLIRKEAPVADHELDLRTKDGEIATMLVSIASIQVGDEACILAAARDITIRKRVEAALRRTEAELARVSRERAVAEERQRLARELHDSVSQALYGISLGVNTALTLLDVDRSKVVEALDYSLSQTQAGLAEMRALIFALRPEALATEGVVAALSKETAALIARRNIEIELSLCDEPDVPLEIKEALYRIAQEAMQNAVKHARCNRLDVRMTCERDGLSLEVRDNGVGFDPLASYPGHLGLHSMRERAMSVGGTLDIISAPSCGTQIRVQVPTPPARPASSA